MLFSNAFLWQGVVRLLDIVLTKYSSILPKEDTANDSIHSHSNQSKDAVNQPAQGCCTVM